MEALDLSASRWERLDVMPSARSGGTAVACAGRIHLLGGLGNSGLTVPVVDRFDVQAGGADVRTRAVGGGNLHACRWETCYIFAYCGLVGNPDFTAKFRFLLPYQA